MMTQGSKIIAQELLPQKGGDSQKEHQLSELNTAVYKKKLLEVLSSDSSEFPGKILKSTEAQNYIRNFISFQKLAWEIVDIRINNDYERIMSVASDAINSGSSLHLNPQLKIPKQQRHTDFHWMPGGYLSDTGTKDILAGLRYLNYLNFFSKNSPFDSFSNNLVPRVKDEFIDNEFPNFNPKRILDLGCGIGHNTISLKNLYPNAEVMGVDLASAMLRCGYVNARLLKQEVKFYQQNAQCTEFPHQYFDLVTSILVFHEITNISMKRIIQECSRILRPGGIMVHFDSGMYLDPQTLKAKVFRDIEAPCNNESVIVSSPLSTIEKMIEDSGMKPITTKIGDHNPINNNLKRWQIIAGVKI